MLTNLRIGTSGWSYPSGQGTWNGIFYPPSPKARRAKGSPRPKFDELAYYVGAGWWPRRNGKLTAQRAVFDHAADAGVHVHHVSTTSAVCANAVNAPLTIAPALGALAWSSGTSVWVMPPLKSSV